MHYRGKIQRMTAKNDALIRELLANPLFKVLQTGEVFTRTNEAGNGLLPNEEFRRCDAANGDGYRVVNISIKNNGRRQRKKLRVHRIVFQGFLGDLDPTMVVNHKNGNKSDNRTENLEQIEGADNTRHAIEELGHNPIRNAVLSFTIAEEIRLLSRQGMSYGKISEKYSISKGHISEIVNYKIWNERAEYEAEQTTPIPF